MLEARSTDGKYDLTLQLKTEVLITRPTLVTHRCSVLYSVWRFVTHRCQNCLVRQLNCGSRFKGRRRSSERHSGWWRGSSLRCVWCVGWCVQHMYDSRTLHLAVGMPLQVETLQKEVQHLRKASMLHSHQATSCKYDGFEYQSSWTATCNFNKYACITPRYFQVLVFSLFLCRRGYR